MKGRPLEHAIAELSADLQPVRRLPSVPTHTAAWLALAVPLSLLPIAFFGLRPDLGPMLRDPSFIVETAAPALLAISAALAAICSVRPGHPLWIRWLPVLPFELWLASLGAGCLLRFNAESWAGLSLTLDFVCFPAILLSAAPTFVVLLWFLRKGAPVAPGVTLLLASLASGSLAAAALRFYHPLDASAMVLVWQLGTVVLLSAIGWATGRILLPWPNRRG